MQRIRHLIAFMLLVVFVPATVMAGPLRLCLGQDGHRAVEFALKGAHHEVLGVSADDRHKSSADISALKVSPEQHQDCTDLSLIAAAVSAAKGCSAKPYVADASDAPAILSHSYLTLELRPSPQLIGSTSRPILHINGDPQLIALRTVILLI